MSLHGEMVTRWIQEAEQKGDDQEVKKLQVTKIMIDRTLRTNERLGEIEDRLSTQEAKVKELEHVVPEAARWSTGKIRTIEEKLFVVGQRLGELEDETDASLLEGK